MKLIIPCLLLIVLKGVAQEKTEILPELNQVIEDFRISIIYHDDWEKFSNLFLHDSITWATINVGRTKVELSKANPNFKFYSSNIKSFFQLLKSKIGEIEEKFYNVKITKRNEFATISFDYAFYINNQVNNWGTEYWSLIFFDNRWKITSVTWTTNLQSYEKCSFKEENRFVLTINSSNNK